MEENESSTEGNDGVDEVTPDMARPAGLKKLAIVLAAGGLILCVLHFTGLGDSLKDLRALHRVKDNAAIELKFVLLSTVLIAVGVPRLMLFAAAGLLFGFVRGSGLAMLSSLAGSYACFSAVRWSGGEWARARFGNRRWFAKIAGIKPSIWSVCMIRQLPVSNLILNSCLALSRTGSLTFLAGSFIGFLPQGCVATLIGSGSSNSVAWKGAAQLASAALVLLGILPWLWRRIRAARLAKAEASR